MLRDEHVNMSFGECHQAAAAGAGEEEAAGIPGEGDIGGCEEVGP